MKVKLPSLTAPRTCGGHSSLAVCEARGEEVPVLALEVTTLMRSAATFSPRYVKAQGHPHRTRAFTMVEVALSLAIVAFAMVAIIGVMPFGLNVQKENREDTIISQDAALLLEAIRGGPNSAGLTVLSSSLLGFSGPSVPPAGAWTPLDVIARLSIPRWDTTNSTNGGLNRAHFRALSGNLGDSAVAGNNMAFSYIVTAEVSRHAGDPLQLEYPRGRTIDGGHTTFLVNNLYEVKLTFSWPVYDSTSTPWRVGERQVVVRTLVSGQLEVSTYGGQLFHSTTYRGQ